MAREGSTAQPNKRPMKIETSFMCLQNHLDVIGDAILPFLPSWFALLRRDNLFHSWDTVGIIRGIFQED